MIHHVLYIHGFAGSIHSSTLANLRHYYPDTIWSAIEVDHHAAESIAAIKAFLDANTNVDLLMGSSLGGFYVLCTPWEGKKIVINPVLHPMSSLKPFIGINNYRGRRDNGDKQFRFTMQDLFAFNRFKPVDTPNTICHYTEHDQVLGDEARREYPSFFAHQEMTKDLRNHYVDEHYIHVKLKEIIAPDNE